MTEEEWLTSTDPDEMLKQLSRRASNRKLRLFGCACYRHVPHLFADAKVRSAVEITERFVDGLASKAELAHTLSLAFSMMWNSGGMAYPTPRGVHEARHKAALAAPDGTAERQYQVAVLHDLFGNKLRNRCVQVSWLTWNDGAIRKLAQVIYNDRSFDRLPLLADALEDAGCTDADMLTHCRGGGEHVRGCWVVDLLLGKA